MAVGAAPAAPHRSAPALPRHPRWSCAKLALQPELKMHSPIFPKHPALCVPPARAGHFDRFAKESLVSAASKTWHEERPQMCKCLDNVALPSHQAFSHIFFTRTTVDSHTLWDVIWQKFGINLVIADLSWNLATNGIQSQCRTHKCPQSVDAQKNHAVQSSCRSRRGTTAIPQRQP